MNLLNTNVNKAIYGGSVNLATALATIFVFYLNGGGEITPTVEAAFAIFFGAIITGVTVWAVPNKPKPEPPTKNRVGVDTIELKD